MRTFAARPSGRAIARHAWFSVFAAFRAMPVLLLGALFLGAVLGVVFASVAPLQTAMAAPKLEALGISTMAAHVGAHFLSTIAWSILAAPVAVAMHRFILLDEATPFLSYGPRHTRLFFLWAATLQLCFFAVRTAPIVMSSVMAVRGLAEFFVNVGIVLVAIRLALIFPAIATDVPCASAEKRIDASFRLVDGKFWLMLCAGFFTFLPFVVLGLGGFLLGKFGSAAHAQVAQPHHGAGIVGGSIIGLLGVLWIMLGAALVSWIYAWARQDAADH